MGIQITLNLNPSDGVISVEKVTSQWGYAPFIIKDLKDEVTQAIIGLNIGIDRCAWRVKIHALKDGDYVTTVTHFVGEEKTL